jgi:hypothetical protein
MRSAIVLCAVAAGFALPGAAAAAARPMTVAQAQRFVPPTLRHEYRGEFSRRTLTRSCRRASSGKVRCDVAWRRWPFAYAGTVTLWYAESDAAAGYATYSYSSVVGRTNIRPRRTTPSRRSGP